ncbi:helix-turn-helix domain-containing protein (plasmid) [Bradyrhizobium barranii]|uniref:Helix-turn-helix domain-containing protein n=1 Tax=Bradyrhizobium barranii TaxID=2992140 RepID=A0ABY3QZS0_9BRAD|nr:helix-turn-helix domain-containing protein [Bradyrhizobium japonicum]UFW91544.1 helix-turn-helix domain-containing protein [Bradyrhizobium japonicum]
MNSAQPISGHKGRDRWICAILTHHDLMTPLELRVAVRLGIFFNCKTGQCDPGYTRLAKELCISPRSARRCVAALVSYGFVGRDEGVGGSHDQKQNFSLFMPARGTDSVSPVRRTASVSPVETEELDQHGGQKHGERGTKRAGDGGQYAVPLKNLKNLRNLIARRSPARAPPMLLERVLPAAPPQTRQFPRRMDL